MGSTVVMWPSYTSLHSAQCGLDVDVCGCCLWAYPLKLLSVDHVICENQTVFVIIVFIGTRVGVMVSLVCR